MPVPATTQHLNVTPLRSSVCVSVGITIAGVLSVVSAGGCDSQIEEERTEGCPACSIRIEREVVLGDDDNGIVGGGVNLVQLRDRYYVSTAAAQHEILVFDLAGRLVRSMGREGPGPGEFSSIEDLDIGPDGNLWIFDARRGLTVIDTLGRYVESHPQNWMVVFDGIEVLSDSTIIMNAVVPTPELVGKWVHAWKPGAGILWSLHDEITAYQGLTEIRHVAPYMDGFWLSWWTDQFRLLQYNTRATLLRELRPVRPWFEEFKVTPPASPENEGVTDLAKWVWPHPTAAIEDIHVDGPTLWVLGYTADKHWERVYDDGWFDLGQYSDAVLEAYDVSSGELLASATFDPDNAWFESFTSDGRIIASEHYEFTKRVSLWSVKLVTEAEAALSWTTTNQRRSPT